MANFWESQDGNNGINPNNMYGRGLGNESVDVKISKPPTSTFSQAILDLFNQKPSGVIPDADGKGVQDIERNKQIKEAQGLANKSFDALPIKKYTFNKDFNYSVWGIDEQKRTIKKGTTLSGKQDANGNITLVSDSSKSFDDFKNYQPMPDMPSPFVTVSSSEKDVLSESSVIDQAGNAIKELTNDPKAFYVKHKTHLLILGGAVLAYFAYKKFKK